MIKIIDLTVFAHQKRVRLVCGAFAEQTVLKASLNLLSSITNGTSSATSMVVKD